MKIYLSPSNQTGNTYAYGGTNECRQCNRIAEYAKKALERCGFEVKKAPEAQSMNVSINESNAWGADLHIPIHTNAGGGNGTIVFVYTKTDANMKYATPIYNEVQAVSPGTINYGVSTYPELAELNSTAATAVYIEVDFHDNQSIAKWLIEHPETVGEAIAKGVCKGAGKTYVDPSKPSPKVLYRVQAGAFSIKKNAEERVEKLKKAGITDAFIVEGKI